MSSIISQQPADRPGILDQSLSDKWDDQFRGRVGEKEEEVSMHLNTPRKLSDHRQPNKTGAKEGAALPNPYRE